MKTKIVFTNADGGVTAKEIHSICQTKTGVTVAFEDTLLMIPDHVLAEINSSVGHAPNCGCDKV